MFEIADLQFDIHQATLDAFIDDDDFSVNWGLDIRGSEKRLFEHEWEPNAYSEILMQTSPYELKSWEDVVGKTISWDDCYDEETEKYHAGLYVFEHEEIYESVLKFISLPGNCVGIEWKAKCNVFWDDNYGSNLDLSIITPIEFIGIWSGRRTEDEATRLLEKAFDPNAFTFTKTEHDVSLFIPKKT